jgi:carboxyl-terminal processing protease
VARSSEKYNAMDEGGFTNIPLIVLTSRGSASASEIVTGAMQDHDRGYVIGETTFGKALVQSVYPIANGAAVALTTAHYYTPSGRLIQRPWDESFDEYQNYAFHEQTESRPHPATELKYTDAGRKVYGGGGIEPDHFMVGPVEGFNPTTYTRGLLNRGAFISFAERFTKEGDTRPAAKSAGTHKVAPGWTVTPALLDEFKQLVSQGRIKLDEAALKTDEAFIAAMIHYEVDNDLFGVSEARKNLAKVDPQAQAALGYFDDAKKLLDMQKK